MMGDISGVEISEDEAAAYSKERKFTVTSSSNDGRGEDDEAEIPERKIEPAAEDRELEDTEDADLPAEAAPDLPLMDF
jgi:hypothetical protein